MLSMLLAGAAALAVSEEDPVWVDVITVTGRQPVLSEEALVVQGQTAPALAPDAAALAARLPGGALIDNGALSGQVQHRGLFGARVPVSINGQTFGSGGPNLMDPPLHYAPAPLLERLEITRGPAPVSAGPAIGARVNAVLKSLPFSDDGEIDVSAEFTGVYRSNNESYAAGGIAGLADADNRLQLIISEEEGGDVETPLGTLNGTEHERFVWGAGYARRLGDAGELRLDFRRQETGPTGNPPFPLDIEFFDSNFSRAQLTTRAGEWRFDVSTDHARIDHGMSNARRPVPSPMASRRTLASAETWAGRGEAARDWLDGEIRIGVDGEQTRHQMTVTNPNNADFFVTPFNSVGISRAGVFAEWEGDRGPLHIYGGLRVDAHEAQAGVPVVGPALPMGPRVLQSAFIAADREWDALTVDGVVRLAYALTPELDLRAAASRKNRAPGYLQRFGWLPIGASAGLADGNVYVGSLDLDAETATALEAGFDWRGRTAYARATVYASWIDDYVQGVPAEPNTIGVVDTPLEMVAANNGDPTPLRFSGVEARLYGFDADFGMDLPWIFRADGVINLVRGDRRDIDDALYRITPDNLRVTFAADGGRWLAGAELVAVAEQDRVSLTNSEEETPGYVVVNLVSRLDVNERVGLSAGVENVLDHRYREHLAGYNRNPGLGVPVGERLPGPGAGVWVRLDARF